MCMLLLCSYTHTPTQVYSAQNDCSIWGKKNDFSGATLPSSQLLLDASADGERKSLTKGLNSYHMRYASLD